MKAYRLLTDRRVEPFGESPRECLILNRTLDAWQRDALAARRTVLEDVRDISEILDHDEHLVFRDDLLFSAELVDEFVTRSRQARRPASCRLKQGVFTDHAVVAAQEVVPHGESFEYPLFYAPRVDDRALDPTSVVVDPDERILSFSVPEHVFGRRDLRFAVSRKFLFALDHWSVVWAANMACLRLSCGKLLRARPGALLSAVIAARSFDRWKVLRAQTRVGRRCDVHATAYVENSVLGDRVSVGAGAVIRNCVVGEDTALRDGVRLEFSVVGSGSLIVNGAAVLHSVLYPETMSNARFMNCCVTGRRSFVAGHVALSDFRFDGRTILVQQGGASVDTGLRVLGSCLGHGAFLGSGCVVAPGEEVPSGQRRVADPVDGFRLVAKRGGPTGGLPEMGRAS